MATTNYVIRTINHHQQRVHDSLDRRNNLAVSIQPPQGPWCHPRFNESFLPFQQQPTPAAAFANARLPPPRPQQPTQARGPTGARTATVGPPTLPTAPAVPHPDEQELNTRLSQSALCLQEASNEGGTKKAFDPKIKEFFEFCNSVHSHQLCRHMLDHDKVYRFMWCQAFRKCKQRGGKKMSETDPQFDHAECAEIIAGFRPADGINPPVFPVQAKPVGPSTIQQYKAVFRRLWKHQLTARVNSIQWEETWNDNCIVLEKYVNERKPRHDESTFAEKWKGEFTPCAMVDELDKLEEAFWTDGEKAVGRQNINAHLRHRYSLLHLTSSVLRCESLYKAEPSDFIMVRSPKRGTDIHPMNIMVNQIMFGKTNKGRKLHGRSTRHRDARKCTVGSLSFYLTHRFSIAREFRDFTLEDWLDDSKWFSVGLLVGTETGDHTKEMDNDSCGEHVKRVLKRLGLFCEKICHLGRNLGAKTLEMLEADMGEIRRLGNWNPSIFDKAHSAKIPLSAIRMMAGFFDNNKFYHLIRSTVEPSDELKRSAPIGEWVHDACDAALEASQDGSHPTALHFLRFMKDINEVLLQDAAAMLILCPKRKDHHIFTDLACFDSQEFEQFKEKMKLAIEGSQDPVDAKLEAAIPGLHQRQQAFQDKLDTVSNQISTSTEKVERGFEAMCNNQSVLQNDQMTHRTAPAKTLVEHASCLLGKPVQLSSPDLNIGANGGTASDMMDESMAPTFEFESPTAPATTASPPGSPTDATTTATATATVTTDGAASFDDEPVRPPLFVSPPVRTLTAAPAVVVPPPVQHVPPASVGNPSKAHLVAKHKNLSDLWDEWHGLGEFADEFGGFEGREKHCNKLKGKEKTNWRAHIDKHQCTRTRNVIKGIKSFGESNTLQPRDSVLALESAFKTCNFGVQAFVEWMQDRNILIKRKARGKQKKAEI